jgi:uncharacterized membrane protein YcaP (DUF421 family)
MVGPDTSLFGGLVAAATLFTANSVVALVARRSTHAAKVIEGTPTVLIRHGSIVGPSLRREGITSEDLLRALREHGVDDPLLVRSAILEVDGTISVLREDEIPPTSRPHHRIRGIRRHQT